MRSDWWPYRASSGSAAPHQRHTQARSISAKARPCNKHAGTGSCYFSMAYLSSVAVLPQSGEIRLCPIWEDVLNTFGRYKATLEKGRRSIMNKVLRATVITSLLLLGTSLAANAADLPPAQPVYKAPPVYAPPQFSWTGFYIGGNLGGGWNQGNVTDSLFGVNFSNHSNGSFLGGGQVGVN